MHGIQGAGIRPVLPQTTTGPAVENSVAYTPKKLEKPQKSYSVLSSYSYTDSQPTFTSRLGIIDSCLTVALCFGVGHFTKIGSGPA